VRIVHHHDPVQSFVVCAIGEPGAREFFLQIESGQGQTTISIEKEQAIGLVNKLEELLRELRRRKIYPKSVPNLSLANISPNYPIDENFRAGLMGITWLSDEERIAIEIQELSTDPLIQDLLPIGDEISGEYAPEIARAILSIEQAKLFTVRTMEIVNSGRQPCPFCGLPINPAGHLCPRANGYKR